MRVVVQKVAAEDGVEDVVGREAGERRERVLGAVEFNFVHPVPVEAERSRGGGADCVFVCV